MWLRARAHRNPSGAIRALQREKIPIETPAPIADCVLRRTDFHDLKFHF